MAPEMAVHVNAMVLLALASMAVKLHFRSLPKSRNPNCGSVARVKLSTVFFGSGCSVVQSSAQVLAAECQWNSLVPLVYDPWICPYF